MTLSPAAFLRAVGGFPRATRDQKQVVRLRTKMRVGRALDPCWFDFDVTKMKVVKHEGRHRAAAAARLGIEEIPVIVYLVRGREYVEASSYYGRVVRQALGA
jgi:hypothetical protein